jgi:hypothetical protein
MKGFVGVTNNDWFAFLYLQPEIDEVYFRNRVQASTFAQKLGVNYEKSIFSFR